MDFDTVDHWILHKKLYAYVIRGPISHWFNSYLSVELSVLFLMMQILKFDDKKCGVPQGSILVPLLFISYMNDISKVSKLLFANNLMITLNAEMGS